MTFSWAQLYTWNRNIKLSMMYGEYVKEHNLPACNNVVINLKKGITYELINV